MRKAVLLAGCLAVALGVLAQEKNDTTIYKVAEEMPRFPACEKLDTTLAVKIQCAQQQLLAFVNANIIYPLEARQNGNEGTVVVSFVVEKDGALSNMRVLKDIGGGCGLEVLRVINLLNEAKIRWVPGKIGGQPVRTNFNLPVKFRLAEAPPYDLVDGDTVYTKFDEPLSFNGGDEALVKYLNEKMSYPAKGNDSCRIGNIDVQLLVFPGGNVKVLNMTDFGNLGFDFWDIAVSTATSTYGKWKPAVYQGRPVPSAYEVSLYFEPTAPACKTTIDNYKKATALANEGSTLFDEGKQEEGIAKMGEAVKMFPGNATFLYMRGQAYLDMNRLKEACADLTRAQNIALNDWYSSILPIICR